MINQLSAAEHEREAHVVVDAPRAVRAGRLLVVPLLDSQNEVPVAPEHVEHDRWAVLGLDNAQDSERGNERKEVEFVASSVVNPGPAAEALDKVLVHVGVLRDLLQELGSFVVNACEKSAESSVAKTHRLLQRLHLLEDLVHLLENGKDFVDDGAHDALAGARLGFDGIVEIAEDGKDRVVRVRLRPPGDVVLLVDALGKRAQLEDVGAEWLSRVFAQHNG